MTAPTPTTDVTVVQPTRVTVYDYTENVIISPPPATAHIERPKYEDEDTEPQQRLLLTAVTFTIPPQEASEDLEVKVAFVTPHDGLVVQGSGKANVYSIKNDENPDKWLDETDRTWLGTWQIVDEKGAEAKLVHKPEGVVAGDWTACTAEQVTFMLESLNDNDSIKWLHQKGGAVLMVRKSQA